MNSTLKIRWQNCVVDGEQTAQRFLDFVINGQSLYEKFGGLISPLGWGPVEENRSAVARFLCEAEPDFPDNRTSVYICQVCGGLDCGAVSAVIERVQDRIVWRDFGYENTYEDEVNLDDYQGLGPYIFDALEYAEILGSALSAYDGSNGQHE